MAQDKNEDKTVKDSFKSDDLSKSDLKLYDYVKLRIPILQKTRQNHYGHNLDQIFADADRDYVPHRLSAAKKKTAIVVDETKGWRSSKINLGESNWQSDVSQSNPFVKIQTALSILVDQNPSGVFTATAMKFQATTELIKQLYNRSWDYAQSKAQLKLFIFNLAKYGWATARTYPLRVVNTVRVIDKYDPENPDKTTYIEKEVVEYDDIMRENLDPRNVWIDDMAKPNNARSVNDWTWRKIYDMDTATKLFGKYPLWKKVNKGTGNLQKTISTNTTSNTGNNSGETSGTKDTENKVEIYFYENKIKDVFMIIAGGVEGVPICIDPLPVSDTKGSKKLSLWQTYWNLRHAESPYGIGIYEAIRFDQAMLDRVRNMTVDQIVMSIYKMFFYQGTQSLSDTGDIKIAPGVGKQVLDPKNVTWLEIPGPGKDAYLGIDMFRKDVDEASGITDPLLGAVTGKTAFEIAQSKEAALKRMKNPLDNITEALNDEAYITVCLMQLLYSIPEVYEISDARLIDDYLKEVQGDTDLFERTPQIDKESGEQVINPETGEPQNTFTAKVYREFPLNLEKDEEGNLSQTKDTQFFRTKPDALNWEGIINIKSQSILSPSKQVDKALELEMYNMLIPLLQSIAQERMIMTQTGQPTDVDNLTNGKTAKEIIKLYDKDPRDILPTTWLETSVPQALPPKNPLFIQAPGASAPANGATDAQTLVPSTQAPQRPQGMIGKIASAITKPFRP
jgi:hypothetical protein